MGEGEGARHSMVLSRVLSTSHLCKLRCNRLINFNEVIELSAFRCCEEIALCYSYAERDGATGGGGG